MVELKWTRGWLEVDSWLEVDLGSGLARVTMQEWAIHELTPSRQV